ncbi:DNA/RNA nuclease SfsA [bacterium]|nr:DNA/RNA nuclease SfsA [bacterium]
MRYKTPILEGRLLRRYKRFLADVLVDGEEMTVHCPNSGSMAGLKDEGNRVRISGPHAPTRKLRYGLEQIEVTRPDGQVIWVGVNTAIPNHISKEAIEAGIVPGLEGYDTVRSEVKLGDHSRIDLLLESKDRPPCWVEVKNTTVVQEDPGDKTSLNVGDIATFPDAVTSRGAKHLDELMGRVKAGERAVMLYTAQRADAKRFAIARGFDPGYAEKFREALEVGVEAIPMLAEVTSDGVTLTSTKLDVLL